MKNRFFLLLLPVLFLFSSCRPGGVISQTKLTNIFYDMFMTDGLISVSPEFMAAADTSSVYGAIFEKYNCTSQNFLESVDYYLSKPNDMKKILTNVQNRLNARQNELMIERDDYFDSLGTPVKTIDKNNRENISPKDLPSVKDLPAIKEIKR